MYNIVQGNYQAPYNVMNLLMELENIIVSSRIQSMSDYSVQKNEEVIIKDPNKAEFIGEGTNRFVFKSRVDELPLFQAGLSREPHVFKIPWQLSIGSSDNIKEILVPLYIEKNKHMDASLQYLNTVVPKAWSLRELGINNIIVQEEVITHNNMPRFQNEINKEEAWKNYVMNNADLTAQYVKLMEALDRHFIMADMSLSMTASNFGLKNISGKEILVPLDLGHVIPKYGKSISCPNCGKPMIYTHYADQEIKNTNDVGLINKIESKGGYYRCSDIQCTVTNYSNSAKKSLINDSGVFTSFIDVIKADNELKSVESILREL